MTVQTSSRGTCYVMALKLTSYNAQSIAVEYVIVQRTIQKMQESNVPVCISTIFKADLLCKFHFELHYLLSVWSTYVLTLVGFVWICCIVYIFYSTAFCDNGAIRLSIDDRIPQSYELIYDELAIGRVEVCDGTSYGTLCRDSWNNDAASVVCSELGFSAYGK